MERERDELELTPWSGEFKDRLQERHFRQSVRDDTAELLRTAMLVGALMFLLLGLADHALLGPSASFWQLLGLRLLVSAGCLLTWWAVRRDPDLTFRFLPLNPVIWLGCTVIILIVPLRPETIGTHAPATAVAVMALYLFVPNRIPWMVAANLYLTLGFLTAMTVWAGVPGSVILIQGIVLGFANTVGWLTARRLARLRRQQYASLLDERAFCQRLQGEIQERKRLEERLRHMAGTDELTGLDNRRRFFERADRALRRARRHGSPMTLCMIDLDHFKTINDRYGHATGDRVLVQVASQCRTHIRDIDLIGRFGGEEFVVALPDADLGQALEITERLRRRIEGLPHPDPAAGDRLTVTIGISRVEADEDALGPALKRADEALYRGKAIGRNVVMVAGHDEGPHLSVVDG
ncbi:GGDEF domain-containing protein [Halomonas beimenensis]|uniref:diguanylate cyclase n=1 Tax=Halomonas beimenensis TaxID=475662 RepID=A0A291P5Y8_9GAMM|nr:diguanylate cyclase [Halomonas beimenensis]ATJ82310.1 hypothetical protein BEI_1323 [Halomonas beimenensis]